MSHGMANKTIPFPLDKPAPLLTRRWRTIVDVNGTRYALDVTASYSLLPSGPAGERLEKAPQPAAAAKPAAGSLRPSRTRRSHHGG